MGKGTDKLYITHSEWASDGAYSASIGAGAARAKASGGSFKRLPFNFCALSLQPYAHPVCTAQGTIFELTNILPWIKKHGTNPVDGSPLKGSELIKLHLAKNEDDEYVDPVTYKVFTDNTHIVALGNTGNVFAYDTVERLNVKAKLWRDLVNDAEFCRADIITLQDPQNVAARDLSGFRYLQEGASALTPEQDRSKSEAVNSNALGSAAKILKATEAVARARRERIDPNRNPALAASKAAVSGADTASAHPAQGTSGTRTVPYNAAQHTTGKAAASFTSTGLTPHTSGERALLTDEEYMLRPRRVKNKGYARMQTSMGDLNIELHTEYAPKAVWNFIQLARKGYYSGVSFHRNIRNFMIQGGDPTGTGKGGTSIWGKNFNDEIDGPLTHDSRGVLSMANKGKNTNSSQFFITYRAAQHLDRKHTIFGRVVGGMETLSRLEQAPTDPSSNRPTEDMAINEIVVFVDPFDEFQKERQAKDETAREREEIRKKGGTEDDRTTWTGKKVSASSNKQAGSAPGSRTGVVGKYLKAGPGQRLLSNSTGGTLDRQGVEDERAPVSKAVEEEDAWNEGPPTKKVKAGGFGNFDSW